MFAIFLFFWPFLVFAADSDAIKDFSRIEVLLKSGKEGEALTSATDFLRRFPSHKLADSAQLLVGEIYFIQRDFRLALNEFQKVQRSKSEDLETKAKAGLRAGECWQKMGQRENAQIEWEALLRKFPGSSEAKQAKIYLAGEKVK